jgi:hypothetical protein
VTNGVDIDGVAECDIHGVTVEGSSNAAIRIRNKASAVRVFGLRSNSGAYAVEFNGCNNAYVWGSNGAPSPGSKVAYKGGAQMCRAFLASETPGVSSDIIQEWGDGSVWPGTVRPDGTVLSGTNGPPTQGRWEIGDIVWNKDMTPGKPAGWRCSAVSPTAWVPFAFSPPLPVVIPSAPGNGVQNADAWDTAISANSIHQINGGYNGKRVTIVASGMIRISDSAVGNIWIDGSVGPGRLFRNLNAGDTITLLRIPHATLGFAWREIAKSVSG